MYLDAGPRATASVCDPRFSTSRYSLEIVAIFGSRLGRYAGFAQSPAMGDAPFWEKTSPVKWLRGLVSPK